MDPTTTQRGIKNVRVHIAAELDSDLTKYLCSRSGSQNKSPPISAGFHLRLAASLKVIRRGSLSINNTPRNAVCMGKPTVLSERVREPAKAKPDSSLRLECKRNQAWVTSRSLPTMPLAPETQVAGRFQSPLAPSPSENRGCQTPRARSHRGRSR